jgi:Peptidase family M28
MVGNPSAKTTDPRAALQALAEIERGSASDGEERAARLLATMFAELDLEPKLESERAVGGFWQSTGLAAATAAVAGWIGGGSRSPGLRRRAISFGLAAAATGAMVDDVDNGAHLLRRLLPKRRTTNVLSWAGDPSATETIVIVAHHDAAHTGLLFHPGLVPVIAKRFPDWYAKQNTSVQTGQLLSAGPLLVTLGALSGWRPLRRLGIVWSTVTAALLADVARSPVVCGANDNLSAVAVLLDVARRLRNRPVRGVRVLLLSTGSEESFMEGMRGFVRRHRDELDPATTRVIALECVGSPHLMLMEGEGMLVMRDHDERLREEIQAAADRAGIGLWRGLRLGAGGTDALPALRAGYRAACIAACTELKTPANYHWPSDVPENLDWNTIDATGDVLESLIRGLSSDQEIDDDESS